MAHFGYFTVDIFDCPPFRMFSNGDDPRAADILEQRQFEPYSMKLWCGLARAASSILDIGAHTGVYSLAAAALRRDIAIHAFEPNPFSGARLRVNKHLNRFDHIVEHHLAVADEDGVGMVSWKVKDGGQLASGAGLGPPREATWESAPVYVAKLDTLNIEAGALPIMKIDVEGAEFNVFRGMPNFLKARPVVILETFFQEACDYIGAQLQGYAIYLIGEDGRLVPRERLTACDPSAPDRNQLLMPKEREGGLLKL